MCPHAFAKCHRGLAGPEHAPSQKTATGGKKNHKTEKRAIGMVPMGPVPLRAEKVGARLSRKWARREEIL